MTGACQKDILVLKLFTWHAFKGLLSLLATLWEMDQSFLTGEILGNELAFFYTFTILKRQACTYLIMHAINKGNDKNIPSC